MTSKAELARAAVSSDIKKRLQKMGIQIINAEIMSPIWDVEDPETPVLFNVEFYTEQLGALWTIISANTFGEALEMLMDKVKRQTRDEK